MANYASKTKQGYDIVGAYMYRNPDSPSFNKIIAIVRRTDFGDYFWASSYSPSEGTWGQGYYDYRTKDDAIKDVREMYGRRIVPIDLTNVFYVSSPTDGFGWYIGIGDAKKRVYYLSKARRETMLIKDYCGRIVAEAYWDKDNKFCHLDGGYNKYRLYADGHVLRLNDDWERW